MTKIRDLEILRFAQNDKKNSFLKNSSSLTVRQILNRATAVLKSHGIDKPQLTGELLVSHNMRCPRLELYCRFDEIVAPDMTRQIQQGLKRLSEGEPLQYVFGRADFLDHAFQVGPGCLIPRPETETLVEQVLACEPLRAIEHPVIIDVGTGNGCIAISLALARPGAKYIATDISREALEFAQANAASHGVSAKLQFIQADLFGTIAPNSADAIISNPPYVRTADWEQLMPHVREHEPRLALDGGPDGLDLIRKIIEGSRQVLKPGGLLFLEIGEDQWPQVQVLLNRFGFQNSRIQRDLYGKDRIVSAHQTY